MIERAAAGDVFARPVVALGVVLVTLLAEAMLAARNERRLIARGAVEPAGDVHAWMRVAYPLGFAACIAEGWWRGTAWTPTAAAGLTLFAAGKVVKYLAIATLGERWTFRVLPLRGQPLVTRGVYRWLRHPNYVGVVGEVLGIALWMQAPMAGTLFALGFGWLLRQRIRVEEQALEAATAR